MTGELEETATEDPSVRIDVEEDDNQQSLQFKLTNFTVFDKRGHIVPIFDPDLINKGKQLYFSGCV